MGTAYGLVCGRGECREIEETGVQGLSGQGVGPLAAGKETFGAGLRAGAKPATAFGGDGAL